MSYAGPTLERHAVELGNDVEKVRSDLQSPLLAERVAADLDSSDRSGVSGTPTFFVNGRRHYGAYDIDALSQDVSIAHARAQLGASSTVPGASGGGATVATAARTDAAAARPREETHR